jgi:hypothetical protein
VRTDLPSWRQLGRISPDLSSAVSVYLVNIDVIIPTLSLGNAPATLTGAVRFLRGKVGAAAVVPGVTGSSAAG